ncbi:protein translocase subunit SecF [Actinoplanes xinjiangensis]|uniref:Protein-export membrane protein SecF n=1 Tax=Actinoplanes xinjiangensis TaxID=512350 RepID=A0A316G9I4_9ACTN|nr:protein translocase subunit SecF [Actinoplanes xinjiangensis]PWK51147.1 protein translocase subunit secF [Actinoplanes xinjiangensis]GIF39872.1 protein translocase subunit SecF [Actinoplanes xinjiangensis]
MAKNSLASRLYQGEANLRIVGRRNMWFAVVAVMVIVALGSILTRGFQLGIEFAGGSEFIVPTQVAGKTLTQEQIEGSVTKAVDGVDPDAEVKAAQKVGDGADGTFKIRSSELSAAEMQEAKAALAADLGIDVTQISDSQVSSAWGGTVIQKAVLGLVIFLLLVTAYLIVLFEWRMALAAFASLLVDLTFTAGVYSLVGFELTPYTVIGFLTILGYSLYDVVVVFDKVQENTRGITAGSTRTYGEATNLAINQTLMRSLNTSLVAMLPVGGVLFIGAGMLGAGTLKDLGLVLFVGMGIGVYSSIFFAAPLLSYVKDREPRIKSHNARVLARRAQRSEDVAAGGDRTRPGNRTGSDEVPAFAGGTTPRPGARPVAKRQGGAGNRPGGKRR